MRSTERTHLILGGGGFIGRHVGLALARRGERVRLAGRSAASPYDRLLTNLLTYETLDLRDADWDAALGGVDVVHHYAWSTIPETAHGDPLADLNGNVRGTLRLLEALRRRGGGRIVSASSGGTVYGRIRSVPVSEEHSLDPISLYGAAKVAVEQYLGAYRYAMSLDCRIARIANPFGVGQGLARNQGAATVFMHRALADEPIHIYGDGEIVRDYIHISDVVSGLLAVAGAEIGRDAPFTFNVASGRGLSLNGIVAALASTLGRKVRVEHRPGRAYDVPISVLNVERARRELGWAPRLSFAAGLQLALNDLAAGASTLSTLLPDS